jgi:hypothetical protein
MPWTPARLAPQVGQSQRDGQPGHRITYLTHRRPATARAGILYCNVRVCTCFWTQACHTVRVSPRAAATWPATEGCRHLVKLHTHHHAAATACAPPRRHVGTRGLVRAIEHSCTGGAWVRREPQPPHWLGACWDPPGHPQLEFKLLANLRNMQTAGPPPRAPLALPPLCSGRRVCAEGGQPPSSK